MNLLRLFRPSKTSVIASRDATKQSSWIATSRFAHLAMTTVLLTALTHAAETPAAPQSEWAHPGADGRLIYKTLPRGDRIMDFSFAGYHGGGVSLPAPAVIATLKPSGEADDAPAIQAALDAAAKLPLGRDGFRGAVLLAPGIFNCAATLTLNASGVVLRGSGSATGGTTLRLSGKPHPCVIIGGGNAPKPAGARIIIADDYVPSGTTQFTVADAASFHVGDTVIISRPITAAWVKFMGMDALVRNGKAQTWLGSGTIDTERRIAAIKGTQLTVDVPLSDCLDAKVLGAHSTIATAGADTRIREVGVEHLSIVSPAQSAGIDTPQHSALRVRNVVDVWARDLAIENTVNSVGVGSGSRSVTIADVRINHATPTAGAAKPADFSSDGSELLFLRCMVTGENVFYLATGARVTGPNVVLDCEFRGGGWIQPHQRWATGLLIDNCRVPGGGIEFMNRGEMGSGHGWTMGWAVAWNCAAADFTIQQPPGAWNWAIGCEGARKPAVMPFKHPTEMPEGVFDSPGKPVAPASLYRAQLRERLGEAALAALK